MPRILSQSTALIAALFITAVSMNAIVTVPVARPLAITAAPVQA